MHRNFYFPWGFMDSEDAILSAEESMKNQPNGGSRNGFRKIMVTFTGAILMSAGAALTAVEQRQCPFDAEKGQRRTEGRTHLQRIDRASLAGGERSHRGSPGVSAGAAGAAFVTQGSERRTESHTGWCRARSIQRAKVIMPS